MSYDRRTYNLGKRERLARKRRRRGFVSTQDGWLKVGRKHSARFSGVYSKVSRKSLA